MNTHGMNWIRKEKRLAIYVRDGAACCWCGRGIEDGAVLTLDHLTPRSRRPDNRATNLVTSCRSCNSARQDTPLLEAYGSELVAKARRQARRALDVSAAKLILARRSWPDALRCVA